MSTWSFYDSFPVLHWNLLILFQAVLIFVYHPPFYVRRQCWEEVLGYMVESDRRSHIARPHILSDSLD